MNLYFTDSNNNRYDVEFYELDSEDAQLKCINEEYAIKKKGFKIILDLNETKWYKPILEVKDKDYSTDIEFGICSNLNDTFASLYLRGSKKLVNPYLEALTYEIREMKKYVDSLIVIANNNLLSVNCMGIFRFHDYVFL